MQQDVVISETTSEPKKRERIQLIDAARGLAVTLMVIHHALYNAYAFFDAPRAVYMNPVFEVLQDIFVGVFVVVSGISSRFSRRNLERGCMVLLIGILISYITIRILNMPILFGILSVLGVLMIFYGVTHKLLDRIPEKIAIGVYITCLFLVAYMRTNFSPTSDIPVLNDLLSVLGWKQAGHLTYDYHPILPWLFVFLIGTVLGKIIRENKFPIWFYETKSTVFSAIGRNALIIYVLHQPIMYTIVQILLYFRN